MSFELTVPSRIEHSKVLNQSVHNFGFPQNVGFYNFVIIKIVSNLPARNISYYKDIFEMNHNEMIEQICKNRTFGERPDYIDVFSTNVEAIGTIEIKQSNSSKIVCTVSHASQKKIFPEIPSGVTLLQEQFIIPEDVRAALEEIEELKRIRKEHVRRLEESHDNFVREAIEYRNFTSSQFFTNSVVLQKKFDVFKEELREHQQRVKDVENHNIRAQMILHQEEEERKQEATRRRLEQERLRLEEIQRRKTESFEKLREQEFINYQRICQFTEMSDADLMCHFTATSILDLMKIRNNLSTERERLEQKYVTFTSMRFDVGEHVPIETPVEERRN